MLGGVPVERAKAAPTIVNCFDNPFDQVNLMGVRNLEIPVTGTQHFKNGYALIVNFAVIRNKHRDLACREHSATFHFFELLLVLNPNILKRNLSMRQ